MRVLTAVSTLFFLSGRIAPSSCVLCVYPMIIFLASN